MNGIEAARMAYLAGHSPRTTTHWWALLTGIVGLIANALLIGFFLTQVPLWRHATGGLAWLGPANDAMLTVQFLALMPVVVAVGRRLQNGRLVRDATAGAVAAIAIVVVLDMLLLAGWLPFRVQGPLVIACISVVFIWMLVVNRTGQLPASVVRFGTAVAASYVVGAGIFGAAFLLPPGSIAQYAGFGLGGAAALYGWLGFPVWPLLLARDIFQEEKGTER